MGQAGDTIEWEEVAELLYVRDRIEVESAACFRSEIYLSGPST